ncbi:hypothetical protein SEA_RICKROSS_35 [Streptomyces phage RickRoss]|nr:hypothetical protein SEA_RICKROSS_35 [Streptomyces phage RickRoss]
MEFGNPIVGQEDLIRSAIKSPDFNTDPESGNVTGWRIARDGSATFYNLTIGSTNFNIDQNGNAVFQEVTADSIILDGTSLADLFDATPRGLIRYSQLTNASAIYNGTTDQVIGRITIPNFDPTREYKFGAHVRIDSNNPGVGHTFINVHVKYAWNAATTATSTEIADCQAGGRGTSDTDQGFSIGFPFHFTTNAGDTLNIGLYLDSTNANSRLNAETINNRIWIEDIGPRITYDTYDASGGATPVTQYVKTYAANESASYQEDGSNRGVASCYQGRYSATNGNQFSMIGFDDAQIRSDTSGATINKVELYLNNNHFYSNSGGNAVIGTHNQTTLSGTHSSSQINDNLQQTHFDLGQAKWITIPNSIGNALRDNTAKGIALGPGPTTSQSYYGYFAGNGESGEPQLRITYTK